MTNLFLFVMALVAQKEQLTETKSVLTPKIYSHLQKLVEEDKPLAPIHEKARKELAEVILKHYQAIEDPLAEKSQAKELAIILICTGNSRRSMMGAAMGNASAAYYGFNEVRFYSGGTIPSAFNSRSIKALSEVGFQIEGSGEKAAAGVKGEENLYYWVNWGTGGKAKSLEFSKHYGDVKNPQKDFIALIVCDEEDCPKVETSRKRILAPFDDPKVYDGKPKEAEKYAERRDDLGRLLLSSFSLAKEQLKPR